MSILTVLTRKIMGLLHSLVVCFKRVLCFLRPRRRANDSLPFTVSSQDAVYSLDGLRGEVPSAQRWDEWSEKPFSDPVEDKINEYRKKVTLEREQMTRRLTQGDEEELEPDYFNEMAPEVKKTKKLLLKQKQQTQRRDLFAVSNEPDIPTGAVDELGLIEDYSAASTGADDAWGDMDDDLDVDSVLREQRHRDRVERQQRRKAEHETRQHHPAQPKRLEAVRISFDS